MNEEEYHQVIEIALSLLHEKAQVDENFVENIKDKFDNLSTEEIKELIANAFYSH